MEESAAAFGTTVIGTSGGSVAVVFEAAVAAATDVEVATVGALASALAVAMVVAAEGRSRFGGGATFSGFSSSCSSKRSKQQPPRQWPQQ